MKSLDELELPNLNVIILLNQQAGELLDVTPEKCFGQDLLSVLQNSSVSGEYDFLFYIMDEPGKPVNAV